MKINKFLIKNFNDLISNRHSLSPVVATILVVAIVVSTTAIVMMWGIPYLEDMRARTEVQNMVGQFDILDNSLQDLIHEGVGASKENRITLESGNINFQEDKGRMIIYYSLKEGYDFNITDIEGKDGFNISDYGSADTAEIFWLGLPDPIKEIKSRENKIVNTNDGFSFYQKYDISDIPKDIIIDRVYLKYQILKYDEDKENIVCYSNVNNQVWDENWDETILNSLSILDEICNKNIDINDKGLVSSFDIDNIFLEDYIEGNRYCSIKVSASSDVEFGLDNEKYIPTLVVHYHNDEIIEEAVVEEVDIDIINEQSYPILYGNWTVYFTVNGTADLRIEAVDDTTWSLDGEGTELQFLDIECGKDIDYKWVDNSVVIEDFSCDDVACITSRVMDPGKHTLMFMFGDNIVYAYNSVGVSAYPNDYNRIYEKGWDTPEGACSEGGEMATATSEIGFDKQDYGAFDFSIPAGSTIYGIEVEVYGVLIQSSEDSDATLKINLSWNSGESWTSEEFEVWSPGEEKNKFYGSSVDDWGHSWTVDEVNNGLWLYGDLDGLEVLFGVDYINVTVYYTGETTLPTVVTNSASNVGFTSARLNGNISNDGGEACKVNFSYRNYTLDGENSWIDLPYLPDSYTAGQDFYDNVSDLSPGNTYEFRAGASNSAGTSWGSIVKFTTSAASNNDPNTPGNPNPINGALSVDVNADISWSGGDPDLDAVTYDVYFGTTSTPPKVTPNQISTTYEPGQMDYNTKYYWKIVAWDEHGASATGPIWNFTTTGSDCTDTRAPYEVDISIDMEDRSTIYTQNVNITWNAIDDCTENQNLTWDWIILRDGAFYDNDSGKGLPVSYLDSYPTGDYSFTLYIQDDAGKETIISEPFNIVAPNQTVDLAKSLGVVDLDPGYTLENAVLINLKEGNTLIGRIWMFDLSALTYSISTQTGSYDVLAQNGAILYHAQDDDYSYLEKDMSIYEQNGVLSLRIIQLMASNTFGGSGGSTYKVYSRLLQNTLREDEDVYMLKFQVFGDNDQGWLDHFDNFYDFELLSPPNLDRYIVYDIDPGDSIKLLLSHSVIKMSWGI